MFERAAALAAQLFAAGQAHAAKQGLILADTKYEMGLRPDGELVVIDEIHTPDSSRYWYADDYEAPARARRGAAQPRQGVRPALAGWRGRSGRGDGPPPVMPDDIRIEAARRYIASYELVTGTPVPVPTRANP